ncbi:MAG: PDZ domain-containing protein, partial [Bacteroidetes bacterium]|nr:PDZ domain-containing protein [Bacteroidota bacterium]
VNIHITDKQLGALIKDPMFIAPRFPFIAGGFSEGSPAKNAGIQQGDKLIAVNDSSLAFFDQFKSTLEKHKNQTVAVTVLRDGVTKNIEVPLTENGKLGIYPASYDQYFEFETKNYGFIAAIPAGITKGVQTLKDYLKQFKLIFNSETEAYKEVGGFMRIGSIFPGSWNWQAFWNLTAFLSIMLAFLNILPIPALDGGHVTFLLYEMVTGRKPSDKFLEYAQIAGLIILFSLILYANGNDIYQFIIKGFMK